LQSAQKVEISANDGYNSTDYNTHFVAMAHILFITKDNQLRSLCNKYWLLDDNLKFTYTAKELSISCNVKIHALHSIVSKNAKYVSDLKCQCCGEKKSFSNRLEFKKNGLNIHDWTCESCVNVTYKREQIIISDYMKSNANNKIHDIDDLNELSLFNLAVFLDYVTEDCWDRGFRYQSSKNHLLTHSQDIDEEIISFLFESGLIKLKPDQNKKPFHLKNDRSIGFDIKDVWFMLNISKNQYRKIYHIVKTDCFSEKIKNNHIIKSLAKKIQLAMCIKKTINIGSEYGFSFKEIEKISLVIDHGLSIHSMNNMYYFIWRSIRDALVQSHKDGVVKVQAIRSVPIRINSDITKSIDNNWNIYKQKLPDNFSSFEYVLFNCVFSRCDYGFYICIDDLFGC